MPGRPASAQAGEHGEQGLTCCAASSSFFWLGLRIIHVFPLAFALSSTGKKRGRPPGSKSDFTKLNDGDPEMLKYCNGEGMENPATYIIRPLPSRQVWRGMLQVWCSSTLHPLHTSCTVALLCVLYRAVAAAAPYALARICARICRHLRIPPLQKAALVHNARKAATEYEDAHAQGESARADTAREAMRLFKQHLEAAGGDGPVVKAARLRLHRLLAPSHRAG